MAIGKSTPYISDSEKRFILRTLLRIGGIAIFTQRIRARSLEQILLTCLSTVVLYFSSIIYFCSDEVSHCLYPWGNTRYCLCLNTLRQLQVSEVNLLHSDRSSAYTSLRFKKSEKKKECLNVSRIGTCANNS